jgi:hypothetical protein
LESASFEVCCQKSSAPAEQLVQRAESLRGELEAKWLGNESTHPWQPRCQILLYATKSAYIAAVGAGSKHTVGSSLVHVDRRQIVSRRIDLLGNQTEFLSAALPHELTHVVLRDRFIESPPPRWADEGMATLADTAAKQGRHRKDLMDALATGATFRAGALLALVDYPPANCVGAFYGESVSLTKFLVDRAGPQQFVAFVERANRDGYDAALTSCYGIVGAGELDRIWRDSVTPPQLTSVSVR